MDTNVKSPDTPNKSYWVKFYKLSFVGGTHCVHCSLGNFLILLPVTATNANSSYTFLTIKDGKTTFHSRPLVRPCS